MILMLMNSVSLTNALRVRVVVISGLIALASSLLIAPPAFAKAQVHDSDSNITSTTCESDVAVIGVRGSGQDAVNTYKKKSFNFFGLQVDQYNEFQGTPIQSEGDASDHIEGFSNEVASAAFELRKQFPDSLKFAWVPVEYEAVSIDKAVFDQTSYIASFREGASLVQDKIHEIAVSCPNTQIAVIGFSQGSQAIHEAIFKLTPKDRLRISSVVLISDPARNPKDKIPANYNEKTKPMAEPSIDGFGIFSKDSAVRIAPQGKMPEPFNFPKDMKGKILSVCAEGDSVCDSNNSIILGPLFLAPKINGFIKHGNIYQDRQNSLLYKVPAGWSANKLRKSLDNMDESKEQNTIGEFSKTILCPDLNFIFAGGHYDDINGGKPSEITGALGADTPATMLWEIVKNKPNKTIGFKGVKYSPSATYGVENNAMDEEYENSLNAGISETNRTIDESLAECKDTRLILFGNEQGAQVMHEAIAKLDKDKLSKIDAVWLMSDPLRNGNDPSVTEHAGEPGRTMSGPASELEKEGGVLKTLGDKRGVSMMPTELSGKVLSLCALSDGFCNTSPSGEDVGYFGGSYNMFSGLYEQPAKWIAEKVK
jgi:hypothetical protein